MLGVYPAEKLFKKGWYKIKISENSNHHVGYFESYNTSMTYTKVNSGNYRTNNFENKYHYSNKSWDALLKDFAESSFSLACFELLSENFDYFAEQTE